ncbi:MAG TPA: FAD-dependent oxidoreductase [Puia sp.]|nr:FAD-dependent oxidoreductase [Puia sp.]
MTDPFNHTPTRASAEDHASARPRADHRCDILIAGAGFAGALTALILHSRGFSVCVVEKGRHPRFAIGESSTPIADLLLRELSTRYDLPWLYPFSRYGSWQEAHPGIVCGIKRGFSYFKHYPGKEFATDAAHSQELLVAASAADGLSDTNWLRADFDAFLVEKVKEAGITYLDRTDIVAAERDGDWTFRANRNGSPPDTSAATRIDAISDASIPPRSASPVTINASFFIDATGGGALLEHLLGVSSSSRGFETHSYGLFSHFDDLPRWTHWLQRAGIPTNDFPYDPDHSALHHVLDEGWIWVLRFNDRRTSLGFALDGRKMPPGEASPQQQWDRLLQKYPTIGRLLDGVAHAAVPGKLILSGRLQRQADLSSGPGWAALPHTAGFIDPLFSSGIAHSLTGIRRLTGILEKHFGDPVGLKNQMTEYSHAIVTELSLIDFLVAGCYATMPYFELFQAWSMVYFAATIAAEQRLLNGDTGGWFLGADRPDVNNMVRDCRRALLQLFGSNEIYLEDRYVGAEKPSAAAIHHFTDLVREKIAPFNIAGLMDPDARNMYRHTVAVL